MQPPSYAVRFPFCSTHSCYQPDPIDVTINTINIMLIVLCKTLIKLCKAWRGTHTYSAGQPRAQKQVWTTWTLSWLTRSTPQPCLEHHQAAPDTGSGEGKPERESCKKGKHWGESADIRGGPLGARTAPWAGLLEGTTAGQRHCTKGCWGLGMMQVASWYHCCLYRATEQIQMEEWAWRYCSCFSTPRKL